VIGQAFTQLALPSLIGGMIGQGIIFAVWWAYFAKSRRVRNTYGA